MNDDNNEENVPDQNKRTAPLLASHEHNQKRSRIKEPPAFNGKNLCQAILSSFPSGDPRQSLVALLHHLERLLTKVQENEDSVCLSKRHSLQRLLIAAHQTSCRTKANNAGSVTHSASLWHAYGGDRQQSQSIFESLKDQARIELLYACGLRDMVLLQFLVEEVGLGVPFRLNDENGSTPLEEYFDDEDVVQYLSSVAKTQNDEPVLVAVATENEYPNSWFCSITKEVMVHPCAVDAPCLHTFEQADLGSWIQQEVQRGNHPVCPTCRYPLRSCYMFPNRALRECIQRFGSDKAKGLQPPLSTTNEGAIVGRLYEYQACRNVVGVVAIMMSYPTASEVQEHACRVLVGIYSDESCRATIAHVGCITALVQALGYHKNNIRVQWFGINALIAAADVDTAKLITSAGGVQAIVGALKSEGSFASDHGNDEEHGNPLPLGLEECWFLAYYLCGALAILSLRDTSSDRFIVDAGGIPAVVEAMKRYEDVEKVQLQGCCILRLLSFNANNTGDRNASNCGLIARAGGIKPIIKAINQHENVDVRKHGIWLLSALLLTDKNYFVECGGIEAVESAMRQHPERQNIQMIGANILRACGENHEDDENPEDGEDDDI